MSKGQAKEKGSKKSDKEDLEQGSSLILPGERIPLEMNTYAKWLQSIDTDDLNSGAGADLLFQTLRQAALISKK